MTAPREDASALVGEVRALQSWPFLDQRQVQRLMRCAVSLCALVEQGERDRRRLGGLWDEMVAQAKLGHLAYCVGVHPDGTAEWIPWDAAILRLAALQPNDSAARTGQEG